MVLGLQETINQYVNPEISSLVFFLKITITNFDKALNRLFFKIFWVVTNQLACLLVIDFMEEIVNRVAQSALMSLDLEAYYPQGRRVLYDLKDNLFQGLILKEKDFRAFLKSHDWAQYQDAHVALACSADAIVPTWAYMLLALHLEPYAKTIVQGDLQMLESELFRQVVDSLDIAEFEQKKVVVKGCSKLPVPLSAYTHLASRLRPVVASLMFGEPCSTVPLYKQTGKQ